MTGQDQRSAHDPIEPLTRREHEIVALLAEGLTSPEMAERLTLALSTVKWHLARIYGKLGANSKRQAITRAREFGLLGTSGPPARVELSPSPARSPGPTVPSIPQHNLSYQVTRFFGRALEIAQIIERLLAWRLVTLTGSGGVGKSRLSLQVAEAALTSFSHGVWFVELAALSDPALVPQQVAARLQLRDEPGRPVLDTLTVSLHDRQALLVLDNCEHLLVACASLADVLLRDCPHLKILASSREPLGIAGEAVFAVPSLPFPDPDHLPDSDHLDQYAALSLFIDRARAVRPGYQMGAHNAHAIARICQRLDGIPLALELAAARLRLLDTNTLAARLEDSFSLLTGGSRTAPLRQQTLRATLDWSYQLLSEEERLLLLRLSVFAGGCTLEAVEAVCSGDGLGAGQVLNGLTGLVDKSMVIADREIGKETRYRLLEMVRQYAQAELSDRSEVSTWRTRHRDYFLSYAESNLPKPAYKEKANWVRKLEANRANLRLALDWSFSTAGLLSNVEAGPRLVIIMFADYDSPSSDMLSSYHEHVAWFRRAIALCENNANISDELHAAVLKHAAHTVNINDLQTALNWATQAVEVSRRLGPDGREVRMQTLGELVMMHSLRDEAQEALVLFAEAEAIFKELEREKNPPNPDLAMAARFAHGWAGFAIAQGDYQEAKARASESIRLHEAAGNSMETYYPRMTMGTACLKLQEYGQARQHYLVALRLADEWGSAWAKADILDCLGATELEQGHTARALDYCHASLRLAAQLPDYNIISHNLGLAAGIAARQGQPARAARLTGAAHALYRRQGRKPQQNHTLDAVLPGWRESLNEAEVLEAFEKGAVMSADQAVAFAIGNMAPQS